MEDKDKDLIRVNGVISCIDYLFKDISLLLNAINHPSHNYGKDLPSAFERLEFLGDRVYNLSLAKLLYENFPHDSEGDLSIRYHHFSSSAFMVDIAKSVGLAQFLDVPINKITGEQSKTALVDTTEALIGAIYLDGGYNIAAAKVTGWISNRIKNQSVEQLKCPKNVLQEWSQERKMGIPLYEIIGRKGFDHAPIFAVRVSVSKNLVAIGQGQSRQAAEQKAAAALIKRLQQEDFLQIQEDHILASV
ncbi:MAG: ribonuclease III [Holosporales bacterium]|jgi:ribonuclease-3|nr:ribonuclease III [Holosporales bacterium]